MLWGKFCLKGYKKLKAKVKVQCSLFMIHLACVCVCVCCPERESGMQTAVSGYSFHAQAVSQAVLVLILWLPKSLQGCFPLH